VARAVLDQEALLALKETRVTKAYRESLGSRAIQGYRVFKVSQDNRELAQAELVKKATREIKVFKVSRVLKGILELKGFRD